MTKEEYKALADALDVCVLHKSEFNLEELQILLKASQTLTNIQNKRIETNEKTARIISEKRKTNKNYARGIKLKKQVSELRSDVDKLIENTGVSK